MKNIALIGLMGVGKTSVGKLLSKKINYSFIDTDEYIQNEHLMTINEIFKTYGEEQFREFEHNIIKNIYNIKNTVIATGGGIVLNHKNVEVLRKTCFIILLQASPDFIFSNISNCKERPLLNTGDQYQKICQLIEQREKYYKIYDYKLDVDNLLIEQVVDEIMDILKENNII